MPEVMCTVSNCTYWAQGNVCIAGRILITAGSHAGKDKEGDNASHLAKSPAQLAEDCYCWTFFPRQDASDEADVEEEAEAAFPVPPIL